MPKRKYFLCQRINNLGSRSQSKKRRLSESTEVDRDKENVSCDCSLGPWSLSISNLSSTQVPLAVVIPELTVMERWVQTFAMITQRTWEPSGSAVPTAASAALVHDRIRMPEEAPILPSESYPSLTYTTLAQNNETEETPYATQPGAPPSQGEAKAAHHDIIDLLQPRRVNGKHGHLPFEAGNDQLYLRMTQMRMLLWTFISSEEGWIHSSSRTACAFESGPGLAKRLRIWTWAFIKDRHNLPLESRGVGSKHSLLDHDDLREEVIRHLQKLGKYVRALDIVELLADPNIRKRHGLKKSISLSTAQMWMHELGYRWMRTPCGQYVDGHEREDVVNYRQSVFLPKIADLGLDTPRYDSQDVLPPTESTSPPVHGPRNRPMHFLFHDESQFYAHNRRETHWVGPTEKAVPWRKGDGASLMVADLVSPEFGWFRSKDGTRSAQVVFRAGKNRDGYFSNQDILHQLSKAMDIGEADYSDSRFCFVLDNATIHLKRADDALSARRMSKWPTAEGHPIFGVETNVIGEDGKPVYRPDGKILKKKIPMHDASLPDGRPQSLYFPDGRFKGMARILEERGFQGVAALRAECPKFKCPPGAEQCCCRRLLYDQPDFRSVETLVEAHCRARGFDVIFLPKFHCELNPIEQCWCIAKRTYREYPPSSSEADLERNMLSALDSVKAEQVRR